MLYVKPRLKIYWKKAGELGQQGKVVSDMIEGDNHVLVIVLWPSHTMMEDQFLHVQTHKYQKKEKFHLSL